MTVKEIELRSLIKNWKMPDELANCKESFINKELAKYIDGTDKEVGIPDIGKTIGSTSFGLECQKNLLSLSDYAKLNEQLERYSENLVKIPIIYFSARKDLVERLEFKFRSKVIVKGAMKELKSLIIPDEAFILDFEEKASLNNSEFKKVGGGLYKVSKTLSGSCTIHINKPKLFYKDSIIPLPAELWIGLDTEGFWPEILTYEIELFETIRNKISLEWGWTFRHSNGEVTTSIKGEKLAGITVDEAVSYYESWKERFLSLWLN